MAVGALFTPPWVSPLKTGAVVPLSKLTFTLTGTGTAANTYSDSALTVPNANPVVADAEGVFGPIYLDPTINYRVKWTTTADVLIRQLDDVVAGQTVSANYRVSGASPEVIFQETGVAANNTRWRMRVDAEQMVISVGNDAESSWVDAVTIDRTANVVDSVNLKATAAQINGTAIHQTGSFTGTPTGGSSPSTGTVNYTITNGNIVTLRAASAIIVNSTSTAFTMTGLPAALQPATTAVSCPVVSGNVSPQSNSGMAVLAASGTITFYMGSPLSTTGFANDGNPKGIPTGWTITYRLT